MILLASIANVVYIQCGNNEATEKINCFIMPHSSRDYKNLGNDEGIIHPSKDSALGKIILSALANGKKTFHFHNLKFLIIYSKIFDYEAVEKYRSDWFHFPIWYPPEMLDDLSEKGNKLIIYNGFIKCYRDKHPEIIRRIKAKDIKGRMFLATASYCPECKTYSISEKQLNNWVEVHKIRPALKLEFGPQTTYQWNKRSILKLYGYNSHLPRTERREILSAIIEEEILTFREVVSYLTWFVDFQGAKIGNYESRANWQEDLYFLNTYKFRN